MRFTFVTLTLLAFYSISLAQGYYPLQVGNQWDYGEIDFHTPGQYTYLYSVRIVGDTTMPNRMNYAIEKAGYGTRYLRQVGSLVLAYDSNKDNVLYDFSLQDGDTAVIVRSDPYITVVTVHVGQGQMFGRSLKGWTYVTTTNTSTDGGSVITITDSIGHTYTFIDGGYTEYLMGALINGKQYGTITRVASQDNIHPSEFRLFQNFPNPFNPVTTIEYFVPVRAVVDLVLYSSLGEKVAVIFHGVQDPGLHVARVDGTEFASGVYFVRLIAQNVSISRSIVLVK